MLRQSPSLGPTLCSPFQFAQDGQLRHIIRALECGLYLGKQILASRYEIIKQHYDKTESLFVADSSIDKRQVALEVSAHSSLGPRTSISKLLVHRTRFHDPQQGMAINVLKREIDKVRFWIYGDRVGMRHENGSDVDQSLSPFAKNRYVS